MSLDYRLVHATAIVSLFLLLVTGSREHGLPFLTFHIDFGIFCGVVLGIYCTILFITHRVRLFEALKNPFSVQFKEAYAILGRYMSGTPYPDDVKRGFGRYNILATYASLGLALSFILLTVGGVAMVFLQRGTILYEEMRILHVGGVGLIVLFFLIHIFAVINPDNRPLLRAMFSKGKVPLDWVRDHLSAYHEKMNSHLSR